MKTRIAAVVLLVGLLGSLVLAPVAGAAYPYPAGVVWYVVRWGDTLWRISRQYGVTVNAIVSANSLPNPNRIFAGQRLLIPASGGGYCDYQVYLVSRGDTLFALSRRFGVTVWSIAQANRLTNWNLIYAGQRLIIPRSSFTIQTPAPGAVLNGSVHVSGWGSGAFENTIVVEVQTASGQVLARKSAIINAPDMGQAGPYAADLTFTAPQTTQPGRVVVYEDSAMDGSIIDQVCVPVTLQGASGS